MTKTKTKAAPAAAPTAEQPAQPAAQPQAAPKAQSAPKGGGGAQQRQQPREDPNAGVRAMQQQLGAYIQKREHLITGVLPKGFEAVRVMNIAIAAAMDDPKLVTCEPLSVLASIVQAARLGLEVGGLAGEAYLIPYKFSKGEMAGRTLCTFQAGYRGWLKIIRSELVRHIHAGVVYSNDPVWEFWESPREVKHRPFIGPPDKRGDLVCAYAVAIDHDRQLFDACWFSASELAQVEQDTPAWRDWYDEMARKTVIKRLAKRLPLMHQATLRAAQLAAIEDAKGHPHRYYDEELLELRREEPAALPPAGRSKVNLRSVIGDQSMHAEPVVVPARAAEERWYQPPQPRQQPQPEDEDQRQPEDDEGEEPLHDADGVVLEGPEDGAAAGAQADEQAGATGGGEAPAGGVFADVGPPAWDEPQGKLGVEAKPKRREPGEDG